MIDKIISRLSKFLLLIATSAFVANVCILLYGVVARYIIGHSPIWMDELSRYLIIFTVLLVCGPAFLQNKHMRVDIIEKILPVYLLAALKVYSWLLTIGISGYIAFNSWQYAFSVSKFTTMGLGISKTIPLLALPIGFGCLFLIAVLTGPKLKHDIAKEIE